MGRRSLWAMYDNKIDEIGDFLGKYNFGRSDTKDMNV